MPEVPSGAIDLILAGPPYWDYIDYPRYIADSASDYYTPSNEMSYSEYLARLRTWFEECFRVLRDGRYCVVNLGVIRKAKRSYPLPFHAVSILEEIGFDFCHEIVWHKVSGGRMHARVAVQHPYPGYYMPNSKTEYLLVFQKHPHVAFEESDIQRQDQNQFEIDEVFKKEIANNIWHIMPACPPYNGKHPCAFPPEIPFRIIKLFSLHGETVLDPFMGIGTTARVARMLGRHYIGYELEKEFIETANRDIDIPMKIRRPTLCKFHCHENKGHRKRRQKSHDQRQ